ncbi:MAG: hydroxysqualene dehydroxylase HpnE [Planctomycetota bacterium]
MKSSAKTDPTPPEHTNGARHVVVAGGGLAGIACAVRLAENGVRVTLIEASRRLGGRAGSHEDPETGETLDNCQHVTMAACTSYLDLLGRLGKRQAMRWTVEQCWLMPPLVGPDGVRVEVPRPKPSIVKPDSLPAPLHLAGSLLGAGFLSKREAWSVAQASRRLMSTDRSEHAHETFGDWLRSQGQHPGVVERFWEPIVVSACNLTCDRVAASVAMHVFQEGLFASVGASAIGIPSVPLSELYGGVAERLEQAGGAVRLGARVASVGNHAVRLSDGERLDADAVVCALPLASTLKLVDPEARDERFDGLDRIGFSPIAGIHLEFDRPVLPRPHAVLLGTPTQWVFRKDEAGRRVHAVASAAEAWVERGASAAVERAVADLRLHLPAMQDAELVWGKAVLEKRATFAATPEAEALRPAVTGPSGLLLAGDWVRTGWPATMEGATRAGYAAAAAVLRLDPARLIPEPRPIARLPRLLGLRFPPDTLREVGASATSEPATARV